MMMVRFDYDFTSPSPYIHTYIHTYTLESVLPILDVLHMVHHRSGRHNRTVFHWNSRPIYYVLCIVLCIVAVTVVVVVTVVTAGAGAVGGGRRLLAPACTGPNGWPEVAVEEVDRGEDDGVPSEHHLHADQQRGGRGVTRVAPAGSGPRAAVAEEALDPVYRTRT